MRLSVALFFVVLGTSGFAAPPEAMVVVVGDQHSAYERTAQFVGRIDELRRENPGVPLAVLINGDSLEYGNVVARRSKGAIDFAMFAALAQRAPTIVNLGNHEPEFYDVAETVRRLETTGVRVISGNLRDPSTGKSYAAPVARVQLGQVELVVVGVTTDKLSTYRLAIRPQLDLADPVVWAKANFPALLAEPVAADPSGPRGGRPRVVPIVLSHAGLRADRAMLPLIPEGTLFAGAHDHLRFVHHAGRTAYFHSGSWLEFISIARLQTEPEGGQWQVEQVRLAAQDPSEPALAGVVRATLEQHLTAEETAVVGHTSRALGPEEAARFAAEAARVAVGGDVAIIGATTFGAGLPAGPVTRFAFDSCVRFDGTLQLAVVEGARLREILARADQGPDTPFAERQGEVLVAAGAGEVRPGRTYRLVTTDWVAKNAVAYLGDNPPAFTEQPALTLKAAVISALGR